MNSVDTMADPWARIVDITSFCIEDGVHHRGIDSAGCDERAVPKRCLNRDGRSSSIRVPRSGIWRKTTK